MEYQKMSIDSAILGREMPFLVFGHTGIPILVFPTQNGRCTDFNDFHMPEAVGDYIRDGRIQLFCVDSLDEQTWSDAQGDKGHRSWMQEQWFKHCTLEFVPHMREINGTGSLPLTTGCSMGATHALNTFLRRPDLFGGVIALSGAYDARYFFGEYMDSYLYQNSIVDYMAQLPEDHPYISLYNSRNIIVCTGQGAWEDEMVRTTSMIRDIFVRKGIQSWVDFWGYDVNHDWPWWQKQLPYFLHSIMG
jgi:esterase/lipase superfamily enzyme